MNDEETKRMRVMLLSGSRAGERIFIPFRLSSEFSDSIYNLIQWMCVYSE